MKYIPLILVTALILALPLLSFIADANRNSGVEFKTSAEKLSYALGMQIGASFKDMDAEINLELLMQGITDQLEQNETRISPEEVLELKETLSDTKL